MLTEIKKDCLLGRDIKPENIKLITNQTIEYFEQTVGNIKVTLGAYNDLMNGDFDKYIIAGITRNAIEDQQVPPLIDSQFIRCGYKTFNPPTDFIEKVYRFLKYLYLHGGRENKKFELDPEMSSPLAYADPEEFIRIIEYLEKQYWINIGKIQKTGSMTSQQYFIGVELTASGMDEIEKKLPKIPLIGLVNEKITTGNIDVDEKINHAKNLFFNENATVDNKRSACETLSYVLEPLRNDLESFFTSSDVNDFFQIVNRFDIRHNKQTTINLVHEEQLEWIFYTLLNSINTFVKLKRKQFYNT